MEQACVHIYTGNGKGKTTAAAGLAARALGQGLRVGFFQFLKNGMSGETISLAKLGAVVVSPMGSGKFLWDMNQEEKAACAAKQDETLARAIEMAPGFDLLVLDEVICAVEAGVLSRQKLVSFIENKPAALELVLTGRGECTGLLELADYVTEMGEKAHPYNKGLAARKGVEF